MKKVLFFLIVALFASTISMNGCKKESGDNGAMLMMAMGGAGSTSYRGATPGGDFVEMIVDRGNKTVTLSNFTSGDLGMGPYGYINVDPGDTEPAGFTILNKAVMATSGGVFPADSYVLFIEAPDETAVVGIFDSGGAAIFGPIYAVALDNGDKSQYYLTKYNLMHIIEDVNGSGDPDLRCGFAAFDNATTTPAGRVWGAEYSIRDDTDGDYDDMWTINDGSVGVGSLVKDAGTGAWVNWASAPSDPPSASDWNNAIALIGNHNKIVELVFGSETDSGAAVDSGGGGVSIPQAGSADFNAAKYPGTYAAIAFEYLYTGTMSVSPYKAVVTAVLGVGHIKIYDSTDTLQFDQPLTSLSGFDSNLITAFTTTSLIAGSADSGIQTASSCNGAFIAYDSVGDVIVIIVFDPDGKFGAFYMLDRDPAPDNDYIGFGLAIKDKNFVNP